MEWSNQRTPTRVRGVDSARRGRGTAAGLSTPEARRERPVFDAERGAGGGSGVLETPDGPPGQEPGDAKAAGFAGVPGNLEGVRGILRPAVLGPRGSWRGHREIHGFTASM